MIDQTYFIRELHIPNLNEMDSDVLDGLKQSIDRDVPEVLRLALGYSLFKDLYSSIVDGVLKEDAPQKWKDFVNGKEYLKDGKLYRWKGLIYSDGVFKGSLLAKYVFYKWLKHGVTVMTGTGEKVINASNSTSVNSTQRFVNVWNDFLNDYQKNGHLGINKHAYFHNGVSIQDYSNSNNLGYVSLIEFLQDNETDYSDANLHYFPVKNQLGL